MGPGPPATRKGDAAAPDHSAGGALCLADRPTGCVRPAGKLAAWRIAPGRIVVQRIVAQRSAPETVTRPGIGHAESTELDKRYHLILLDDDDHSYAYVVEMLGRLFGYSKEKAFAIAAMVDTQGRAIVETASYDRVRHDQQRIHDYGPDPRIARCLGSMSALVEEA